jgi:hypothetical protein
MQPAPAQVRLLILALGFYDLLIVSALALAEA